MGVKFIGDLSLEDADVLIKYGRQSDHILEFGAGGSTQIFSQCVPKSLVSLDTDKTWIDLTKERLKQIDDKTDVEFFMYNEGMTAISNRKFDLIFVDGTDLRLQFALNTWKLLNVGGHMIFHDTRVASVNQYVCDTAQKFFNEIEVVYTNVKNESGKSSNMSIIKKKQHEEYVNWNHTEGKPQWAYGRPMDASYPLWEHTNS